MSDLGTGFVGGDHRDDARGHLDGLLVRVDLDVQVGDLGELADLDVLAEQGGLASSTATLTVPSSALDARSSSALFASAATA